MKLVQGGEVMDSVSAGVSRVQFSIDIKYTQGNLENSIITILKNLMGYFFIIFEIVGVHKETSNSQLLLKGLIGR